MTNAEMNRRLAELTPKKLAHLKRLVFQTTYSAHDIAAFKIPGISIWHINAMYQKWYQEV